MTKPVRKSDIVELEIEDLVYGGNGIAHVNDYVVFVEDCVPGQTVKAKVHKATSSYAEAHPLKVLEKSPIEVEPECPYFDHCGGCNHQDIPYEKQIQFKKEQVENTYKNLGNFENIQIQTPLKLENNKFRYRNKMEFAFSPNRWLMNDFEDYKPKNFALGLRPPGYYWKAIDLDDCVIAPQETEQVLHLVRKYTKENNLSLHDVRDHEGYLRHLMLRKGINTNQLMINVVTNDNTPEKLEELGEILKTKIPTLNSFINTYTENKGGTTEPEQIHLLEGEKYISDKIYNLEFRISSTSFFQTNTKMAEKLYSEIKAKSELSGEEIVWDLYSGTGSISLFLADKAKKIIGFELASEAVEDAKVNAKVNNIENVEFLKGNLNKFFSKQPEIIEELPDPDLIVLDPPRAGMHPQLLKDLCKIAPPKIVYVSCKPPTQVRDINKLAQEGYEINSIRPVDMFPQTAHIEVVTRLTKKNQG